MLSYASNNKQEKNCNSQRNRQIQATPVSLKFESPRQRQARNPDTPSFANGATPESLEHHNTREFAN